MIGWIDNGPVTVISNVHADLFLITVKRWNSSFRNKTKINRPHCITKYHTNVGGVDTFDTLSVFTKMMYMLRNSTGPFTSTLLTQSTTAKAFKILNPDAKMDYLTFTHWFEMHYLKMVNMRSQLPTNILYPRKRS